MIETARPEASGERADVRLRAGSLADGDVQAIARCLAEAHERAAPADPRDAPAPREDLRGRAAALARALPELADGPLREVEEAQRRFLDHRAARLHARAGAGRVRAELGASPRLADLRLGASPGARLRRTRNAHGAPPRDVCADLARLALELAGAGRGDLAERLLSDYAGEADDFDLYGVADYYECDAALSAAEDRAARARDAGPARRAATREARRLLLLALATRRRPLLPPVLVAVGGLVASGKSTVSRALAARLGAPRVEADRVRDFLVGDRSGSGVHESQWEGHFAGGFQERVYTELLRRAEVVLDSGRPVVLDACFPRAAQRAAARALAKRYGRPFLFVECRCSEAAARERLAARDAAAGRPGWTRIAADLARRWEPDDVLPPGESLVVRSDGPLEAGLDALRSRLPVWPEGLHA